MTATWKDSAHRSRRGSGFFDLEVYRNEYEYERDDDIGVHVEYHRETYLKSRELTVDNVRTAVRDFELAVPDKLANELTEWQEKYWDGNKIESNLGDRLTPEEIEMAYGGEAPEETSERLRLEFGSALAETQGISGYETLGDAGSGKSRLIHSALAEAQGGANYESPKIAGEGDDEIANRPGYTMEEWERMQDRELDRRYEAGIDLMEAEGIRRAELELRREQNEQAKFPRLPFIEDALDAGAAVEHISARHHGSDWTVVSFDNARGTYLLKDEDVYVTQASVQEAQAAIEADPVALPGIGDLKPAGDIEVEAPDVSFSHVVASMGPNNRALLERALADGAVVNRFWAERSEGDPERYAMAVVSLEDAPGTYIFWNGEDGAQKTKLDFGATRYALDFGYDIGDLGPVSEIRSEKNKVEPRGRSLDHSLSM
jgi:hypothetical protein